MSVTVKAYLNFTSSAPEIRRFSIDADASTSYDYLVEKIRNAYPQLKREDFHLFWKDEENEFVAFSSDEELIDALTQHQGGFFRVYVKVVSKKDPNASDDAQVHPLVTCDGCDGKVVGSRFKCSVCPDYDLCSTCECKGLHAHHHLLRIRNPGSSSFIPPCPPFFMPWMHGRGMGPRGGFCGPRGGFCGPRRGGPNPRGPNPRGVPFHGSRGGRGFCPRFPGSNSTEQSTPSDSAREGNAFFHQFGEALNSFLGPFGVDVHTYDGKNEACGQHEGKKSPASGQGEASNTSEKNPDEPMDDACSSGHDGDHTYIVVDETTQDETNPDPQDQLANALAHMKAMGFDDEGGWLSQLLKAKDYDINKVLDAIQHPEKKA